jgi:hypothetical protein
LQRKLREDEKVETARRLDRQRELKRKRLKERMESSMSRVKAIQTKRGQPHQRPQEMMVQPKREKDKMKETVFNNRTEINSPSRLADLYGIA